MGLKFRGFELTRALYHRLRLVTGILNNSFRPFGPENFSPAFSVLGLFDQIANTAPHKWVWMGSRKKPTGFPNY